MGVTVLLLQGQWGIATSIRGTNAHHLRERRSDKVDGDGRFDFCRSNGVTIENDGEGNVRFSHQLVFLRVSVNIPPSGRNFQEDVSRSHGVVTTTDSADARSPSALKQALRSVNVLYSRELQK